MTITNAAAINRPEPKRDRWGRYIVAGPDGKQTSHQRATTFAKLVADTYNLSRWQIRSAAQGFTLRHDLLASYAALRDPNGVDKSAANAIADQAIEAASASAGANMGTALHTFTERVDLGEPLTVVPEQWRPDIAAYQTALADNQITLDPNHIEGVVILDDLQVAGTFDRIVTVNGERHIADLKTGKDPAAFPHEICIQLALYAHADAIWNTSTSTREPMPEVNRDRALVIHLRPSTGVCDLWWFDISAGWEMVRHCEAVKAWRARKDLTAKFDTPSDTTTTAVQAITEAFPGATVLTPSQRLAERRGWIKARIAQLGPEARGRLGDDVALHRLPALKDCGDESLDRWAQLIAHLGEPFDGTEADPTNQPVRMEPKSTKEIPAKPAEVKTIEKQLNELPAAAKELVGMWAAEAGRAGRSLNLRNAPTQRKVAVADALVACAVLDDDGELTRILLARALDDELQPTHTTGAAFAALSIDEARRIVADAHALAAGTVALHFADDGTAELRPTAA